MEPFFLKVQKTLIFLKFDLHFKFYIKLQILSKKAALWRLMIYGCRTFKKKISLIAVAVSEIIRNGRTDAWTHERTDTRTHGQE